MRALVFGGNRYIGLQLVFELARQGHDVTVVNSHEAPLPATARRWHADRRVPGALVEVLRDHREDFDIVYDNTAYQPDDLRPLVDLFRGHVRHYVFTSSVAVYKRSFVQPVREDFPRHDPADRDPRKAYGVGKVCCEDYLRSEFAEHGFPFTTLRVTHTIGPNSALPREHAFFARIEQGRPVLVPGEGFPFVHLVHTLDVARLMVAVAGNETAVGRTYNVAGAEVTSVRGCMELMARAVGRPVEVVSVPVDVAASARPPLLHWGEGLTGGATYAIDAALADLEWRPRFGLQAAYRDAYAWFAAEGRGRYDLDFSGDDEILRRLA